MAKKDDQKVEETKEVETTQEQKVDETKKLEEDDDLVTLNLKVKNIHPTGLFRIGATEVKGFVYKAYKLTEAQVDELISEGPAHFLECKEHDLVELLKERKAAKKK